VKAVAVALTPAEQRYLLELLQREAEKQDEPIAWDILQMLENAVEPGLVASLTRELRL
jgi:hypothetical protein